MDAPMEPSLNSRRIGLIIVHENSNIGETVACVDDQGKENKESKKRPPPFPDHLQLFQNTRSSKKKEVRANF